MQAPGRVPGPGLPPAGPGPCAAAGGGLAAAGGRGEGAWTGAQWSVAQRWWLPGLVLGRTGAREREEAEGQEAGEGGPGLQLREVYTNHSDTVAPWPFILSVPHVALPSQVINLPG